MRPRGDAWPTQRADIGDLWAAVAFVRLKKLGTRHPDAQRAFRTAQDLQGR